LIVILISASHVAIGAARAAQEPRTGGDRKLAAKPADDAKAVARISILRLQIVRPQPPSVQPNPGVLLPRRFEYEAVPPAGTSITLLVEDPERLIHAIESKECRIISFHDDKGTDLLEAGDLPRENPDPRFPFRQPPEGPFVTRVDPGGHWATVTIHSPRLPAGTATKITLEANLVVKYSSGERTVEQKNVDLKMDKITASPVPLIIARQQDPNMMIRRMGGVQDGTQVILFYQGDLLGIKKIAFVDADGNEIQAMSSGGGSNGSLNQSYYRLARKVDTCTVRVTVPEKIETATVAISLTAGVGFLPTVRRSLVTTTPREDAAKDSPAR
jgi:hypothetical protein